MGVRHRAEPYHGKGSRRNEAKKNRTRRKMRRERERRKERYDSDDAASACTRKFRYESRHSAMNYIRRHHSDRPLSTYRCPYCGGWHLTSHPRPCGPGEGEGDWDSGSDT